jgi:hypothetical protein
VIHKYFNTRLTHPLDVGTNDLPISSEARGLLVSLIPQDEVMLLVLEDCVHYEEVEVTNYNGHDVYITRRDVGGTGQWKFPKGATLDYRVTVEVVKDLVCNYDCCTDEPCPKTPVSISGELVPDAKVDVPWTGAVVFAGTLPLILSTGPLPAWLTATVGPNFIRLGGTPTVAGDYHVSVAGADTIGTLAAKVVDITVTEV